MPHRFPAVCDTVVRVDDEGVLFAKNSDRDPNEAQLLEWHPAARHPVGAVLRCTWVGVAQVRATRAILISRPWWLWGAEMGANDAGVVIGNEAVFTTVHRRDPAERGLLGMDLLRLALERAGSAEEAVEVIVSLLERHGQRGPASFVRRRFSYDNSFIVADPTGAIVLESAGRRWAVERVERGVRGISNLLTIPGFAEAHSDRVRTAVAHGALRRACTERATERARRGPEAVLDLFGALAVARRHPRTAALAAHRCDAGAVHACRGRARGVADHGIVGLGPAPRAGRRTAALGHRHRGAVHLGVPPGAGRRSRAPRPDTDRRG